MLSDAMLDASEDIKDYLKKYPDMYLPWHRQEAEKLARQLAALGNEIGNNPHYWKETNPNTVPDQHQVVIDGHILSPKQSHFVVEAIEDRANDTHDQLMSYQIDDGEKTHIAPAFLSLAEVLKITHPNISFSNVGYNDKDRAIFTGDLESFNPLG